MRTSTRLIAVAASAAVLSLAGVGAATADGSTGTTVAWSTSSNGNTNDLEGGSSFQGTAQFPGEGPVGYRGSVSN
ncbi:hypothetical protein [Streptomyces sp. NPDC088727]|uniref:hypothetical protein n=1 Tax=Streptomyces sp. NPDC088727 TaxID=3365875 RepID=UPI00380135EE